MDLVTHLLSKGDEPVDIVRIDWRRLIFETPHGEVRFFLKDSNPDWLMGLNADAIFGEEYPELLYRAKPNAIIASKYGGALTGYIRWIEREASKTALCPKTYITTAGSQEDEHNNKLKMCRVGEDISEFFKRMLNYTYGKFPERPPVVYLDTDMSPKVEFIPPRNGKTQACLKYLAQEFMKNINKEIVYGGENNMTGEERTYIHQDISSLAAAFKRVNDAFNRKFPGIKNVIFSGPCTIVLWEDGTKTIVRCEKDALDPEKGLAMAIAKKALGTNKSGSNYYDIFKKWLPKDEPMVIDYADAKKDDATCQE
jgi:hypothetical protein